MKPAPFWDITRRSVVIVYRRFGTTYRSHLHGSRVRVGKPNTDSWPLKIGPIRCPETSVNNYHTRPCNTPEDRRFLSKLSSTVLDPATCLRLLTPTFFRSSSTDPSHLHLVFPKRRVPSGLYRIGAARIQLLRSKEVSQLPQSTYVYHFYYVRIHFTAYEARYCLVLHIPSTLTRP
jgi:hypothetical protein